MHIVDAPYIYAYASKHEEEGYQSAVFFFPLGWRLSGHRGAQEGLAHEGLASEGTAHEGPAHESPAHEGLAHKGRAH